MYTEAAQTEAGQQPIDLRSDTVTRPSAKMRQAMAAAEVGDDVYGEDPTVSALETRAAEIFAREAALFVPTGSMGNQIAVRLHTQHGQEVVCEARAHILDWEMGMVAAYSGCQLRPVRADRGIFTWDQLREAIRLGSGLRAPTGLLCVENTYNMAGGTVTPLENLREIWDGARELGLPVHLDGARIFNAAVALGRSVRELTSGFDTVMFCLSKGLGAPVGSMLVGSKSDIDRARSFRKALGGGMRQAGIIAAAGLVALEDNTTRLAEDHANARILAECLAQSPAAEIDLRAVQTNIVIARLKGGRNAPSFCAALKAKGVLASAISPCAVRFVTHLDVNRGQCEQAARMAHNTLAGWSTSRTGSED